IEYGAEVHVAITGNDPVVFRETFVIEPLGSGMFDETLTIGDHYLPGAGGGAHVELNLTYQDVLIDSYSAPLISGLSCPGLVPLAVTIDATGDAPAGLPLDVAVRRGECGNDQTPSAVLRADATPATITVLAHPNATCPSPVDALG